MPKISVILSTVRPNGAYWDHIDKDGNPEKGWGCLEKVLNDLELQTFRDFEFIIVDGLYHCRELPFINYNYHIKHIPPRKTIWTKLKKYALCAYRNTGLIYADGELCINLDDCCELPNDFLSKFWYAYDNYKICLAALWPNAGDSRYPGLVSETNQQVYEFRSYPLDVAIKLNGYDEAYDGGRGIEDIDFTYRTRKSGVEYALNRFDGFILHNQVPHSQLAIDVDRYHVKCSNQVYNVQRELRNVMKSNELNLWDEEWLKKIVGPCHLLMSNGYCKFHEDKGSKNKCPYLDYGIADKLDEEAKLQLTNPPVFDLELDRKNREKI